jgi:hypothetical protein
MLVIGATRENGIGDISSCLAMADVLYYFCVKSDKKMRKDDYYNWIPNPRKNTSRGTASWE